MAAAPGREAGLGRCTGLLLHIEAVRRFCVGSETAGGEVYKSGGVYRKINSGRYVLFCNSFDRDSGNKAGDKMNGR